MEKFRELIRGWLGKVLLVLFLTPLAIGSFTSYFGGKDEASAFRINGEEISQTEYDQWLKSQQQKYLAAVNGDQSLLNQSVITKQVYEAAIMRTLLLQRAKQLGITLTDAQLGDLLRQMPALQEGGQFSQTKLDQLLAANQITVATLLDDFRKETAINILADTILKNAILGAREGDHIIALLGQQRSAQIAEIPLQNLANDFVATPAQINQYYQTHAVQFTLPEAVDVQYVVLDKAHFAQQIHISDTEIQAQYQRYSQKQNQQAIRHIRHILIDSQQRGEQRALERAQQVIQQLNKGIPFETLVQQYSDDPISKAVQGKVEGYTEGVYGQPFDQAVSALKTGQYSAPIKTQYGYHIIRLDDISQDAALPLAQVREQMIAELRKTKSEQAFQEAVNAASDLAVQTDDLSTLAQQYRVPLEQAKSVIATNQHPVLSDTAVKNKLFSAEVAQGEKTVSAALTLKNGNVVWVKPMHYYPKRQQPLSEVTAIVQSQLKREAQLQQAKALAQPILKRLSEQPLATAFTSSPYPFKDLGVVSRFSQAIPPEVERAIYSTARPTGGYAQATTAAGPHTLYIIAVTSVRQDPQLKLSDAQRAQVFERFAARGQNELNDYLAYWRSLAKITPLAQKETR